jgi:ElaB/YqjD/DUF883 family membrane-anchored ribosome-binding protein
MRLDEMREDLERLNSKLKERWAELTSADLSKIGNDLSSLTTVVSKRYGIPMARARAEVQEFKTNLGTSIGEVVHAIGETAAELFEEGRNHAAEAMRKGTRKASELWSSGTEHVKEFGHEVGEQAKHFGHEVEGWVKSRPMTSLAIAAGAGALIAFLCRRRA